MLIIRVYLQNLWELFVRFNVFTLYYHKTLKKKHVYNHDTTLFQNHHVKNIWYSLRYHTFKQKALTFRVKISYKLYTDGMGCYVVCVS